MCCCLKLKGAKVGAYTQYACRWKMRLASFKRTLNSAGIELQISVDCNICFSKRSSIGVFLIDTGLFGLELTKSICRYDQMSEKCLILLVEDNEIIGSILSEILETAGFELELAENGNAAIDLLNDRKNDIRGIVTDIQLESIP